MLHGRHPFARLARPVCAAASGGGSASLQPSLWRLRLQMARFVQITNAVAKETQMVATVARPGMDLASMHRGPLRPAVRAWLVFVRLNGGGRAHPQRLTTHPGQLPLCLGHLMPGNNVVAKDT